MAKINKLVRDLIPQIIQSNGQIPVTRVLSEVEIQNCLNLKLQEEVTEYLKDNNPLELADILEVIYAIAKTKGISIDELEKSRLEKLNKNGGFTKNIFLIETSD